MRTILSRSQHNFSLVFHARKEFFCQKTVSMPIIALDCEEYIKILLKYGYFLTFFLKYLSNGQKSVTMISY